jgi:aminoglycoside 6'-N-acetyltransferase
MTNITAEITFRPLQETDLSLLHKWFNTPHVSRWWEVDGDSHPSLGAVRRHYLPRVSGGDPVDCYVILYSNRPIGMVQACQLDDFPEEKANFGLKQGCVSIDICIGEEYYVHRGLGSLIIRKFVKEIVFNRYNVDCCTVDPAADNEVAIRAYNKAGFRFLKSVWYKKEGAQENILTISRQEVEQSEKETLRGGKVH